MKQYKNDIVAIEQARGQWFMKLTLPFNADKAMHSDDIRDLGSILGDLISNCVAAFDEINNHVNEDRQSG